MHTGFGVAAGAPGGGWFVVAAARAPALRDLTRILDYVDALSALDTDGVQPMSHALRLQIVLRADEPAPSMAAQDVLQNAPERKDGCFLAPRAVE